MAEETIINRTDLYELVWSEPVSKLAKRFRISGVALAKICRKLNVPRPTRGYWARRRAGHKTKRPPLPISMKGQPSEHRLFINSDGEELRFCKEVEDLLTNENDPESKVVVPVTLINPHPLVRLSKPLLSKKYGKRNHPRFAQRCLDIDAGGSALNRSLLIMDTILKALEKRGLAVECAESKRGQSRARYGYPKAVPCITGVQTSGVLVEFGIHENHDIVRVPPSPISRHQIQRELSAWPARDEIVHNPNGLLTLSIKSTTPVGARRTWSDGKKQRLEGCLNDFIRCVLVVGESVRLKDEEWERWQREQEKTRERRRFEVIRVFDLDSRLEDWCKAGSIRNFAAAVEKDALARMGQVQESSDLDLWLQWARKRADSLEAAAMQSISKSREPPPGLIRSW